MISIKTFYKIDTIASPFFDFIDRFVDDFDKVWDLKEALHSEDFDMSVEDFERQLYFISYFHIYITYKNMDEKFRSFDKNRHLYFTYGLFRAYCHENYIVSPDYDDFLNFEEDHDAQYIASIWNICNSSELDDIKYPFYYASSDDSSDYYSNLFDIAGDIYTHLGKTAMGKEFLQNIFDLITDTIGSRINSIQEELVTSLQFSTITEDDYDTICNVIFPLYDFLQELNKNQVFIDFIKDVPDILKFSEKGENFDRILFLIFTNQLCNLYKHLNLYPIDSASKEGSPLALWMIMYATHKQPSYEEFLSATHELLENDELNDTLETISDVTISSNTDSDDNIISLILSRINASLQKDYLTLLYNVASAITGFDGNISNEVNTWLAHLHEKAENISEKTFTCKIEQGQEQGTDYIDQLQELIGLENVKQNIISLSNFVKMKQIRESKGMKSPQISLHCVFTGNPGTGKTTVARILAGIFKDLGVLKKGHLIETDRSGLVAEYVGQTAVKTNKIIDSALDGVLFIDEAYSLFQESQTDYGKEAISTLLKRMEDDRERLIVILAGYGKEMQNVIDSNPGLRSRFNRYIEFPDYSAHELFSIFKRNTLINEYTTSKDFDFFLLSKLETLVENKPKDFSNARYIRNLFERAIENQANRLSSMQNLSEEDLSVIDINDIINEV